MNREGMRQAAVLLAGLHPRDRAWISCRLPSIWRTRLKNLISQVRSLGVVDTVLLRDALQCAPEPLPEPPTPDVLLAGLDGLPPAWAARVLVACAPDHRELYLAGRPQAEQSSVERALCEVPSGLPPKLAGALTHLVRQRGECTLHGERSA